jgi:lauroyl/myristoyl acyltransferase
MVAVPFLDGVLRLPTGAPSLALATSATLLPVFALKHTHDRFEVIVEPELKATRSDDRHAAVDELVERYVERIEDYVVAHPDQYANWW